MWLYDRYTQPDIVFNEISLMHGIPEEEPNWCTTIIIYIQFIHNGLIVIYWYAPK
jgi:hypothetical protein